MFHSGDHENSPLQLTRRDYTKSDNFSQLPSMPPKSIQRRWLDTPNTDASMKSLWASLSRITHIPKRRVSVLQHQQNVFYSLGASRSVWEEAECKLRSINFRREWDPRRAFRPAFGVTGISDDWYTSTMGAVVIRLGAPWTVALPMRESWTKFNRCLGSQGYSLEGRQALSEILQMYTSHTNSLHVWCIDHCSLSTSKSYCSTQHLIQHSCVCIATLRRTKDNDECLTNGSR